MRRRRWAAACALAALLLAGCGNPGGVDGDLADDWIALAEPRSFVPPTAVCHESGYSAFASLSSFESVGCDSAHRAETFHVGTFAGAAAGRTSPPPKASAEIRDAYAECDERATAYLGEDFRHGRLWLGVVVPSASGWKGGARWYRCDLFELADVEDFGDPVEREGSLMGALTADSDLRLGCFQVKAAANGSIDTMTPVACTSKHNSEFVGVYPAPPSTAYPKSDSAWQRIHTGCRKRVAAYVNLPDDANLEFRTGTVVVPNLQDDWANGNHGVRCYLYLKDAGLTRSLEGAGAKLLPVR
jgi:hypothetical protein